MVPEVRATSNEAACGWKTAARGSGMTGRAVNNAAWRTSSMMELRDGIVFDA
jgi:hypothetical protein